MLIKYVNKKFKPETLEVIDQANIIIEEYEQQGFMLTLRQLYYQFVARDLIPNEQREYKKLGSIINNARLSGLIDWSSIEDRTRTLRGFNHYNNIRDYLSDAAHDYRKNLWSGQDVYLEVWIEKDALVGVIQKICSKYDVDYFACRGYVSQSEQHNAALRFINKYRYGNHNQLKILHLGDHDPSGIDMTRDIESRMNLFLEQQGYSSCFEINRLALNMEQVEDKNPPANPAKLTDSRCKNYISNFGSSSWELDALEPKYIESLIKDNILDNLDIGMFNNKEQEMKDEQITLKNLWRYE